MEKRVFTRLEIPGTQLKYRLIKTKHIFSSLSRPLVVNNVSKSGLSFLNSELLPSGQLLYMKISFPDGIRLKLKGQVRWAEQESDGSVCMIGVQFHPYGSSAKYNSPKALNYLRQISEDPSQSVDLNLQSN